MDCARRFDSQAWFARVTGLTSAKLAAASLWLVSGCAAPSADADRPERIGGPTESLAAPNDGAATLAATGQTSNAALGTPLEGPINEWEWFDIPGTMCGNGEPTGLAVNWGTGSDLLIVHDGGGACWDEASCTVLPKLGASSEYINQGYSRATFEKAFANPANVPSGLGGPPLSHNGLFDRTSAKNPFRDSSYVFLPYCTGDLSGGDATQQFHFPPRTMHYHGRKNIEAYLPPITSSFAKASSVTLAGRSAGGFATALNFWRFQDAFGSITVNLIDDSGPTFDQRTLPQFALYKSIWNMDGAYPSDCPECKTNVRNAFPYYARKYPKSRFALLSYDNDALISAFFLQPPPVFMINMRDLTVNTLRPLKNVRYFIPPGFNHTMSHDLDVWSGAPAAPLPGPKSVQLGDWLTRMKSGSSNWNDASGLL
jgi:hypothetical protein